MVKISDRSSSTDEISDRDYIKTFSKRMLKTQLFIGNFQEKRFVHSLDAYRDVVKIDAEEKEFIENVLVVKKKIKRELMKFSENPIWIGITDPSIIGAPVGYNLWVILPTEVFGKYWFKVKTVEFVYNEIRLKLEIVRRLKNDESSSDFSEIKEENFDLKATVQDIRNSIKTNFLYFYRHYLTLHNIKGSFTFICLLIATLITGSVNVIQYLMDYLLKMIKELSGLIKVCTPIIISCINLIGRLIYGLYALIATLWQGKPTQHYNSYYNVDPNPYVTFSNSRENFRNNRALPYKSSVTITPLD